MPREGLYSQGEEVGPYAIIRLLATGAMGAVYEATPDPELRHDLRNRGIQRVAVKVASGDALTHGREERRLLAERTHREALTLIDLTRRGHPNVIQVYDFGVYDGRPYYAMELVDGTTLERELEGRPRLTHMLVVFAHLCGAAAFLHNLGICHRDIHPRNVMVRHDGGDPVLIDFGICLPVTGMRLTGPYDLLGTPAYVSPEYAEHWLDARKDRPYLAAPTDDVWALGILFYEILTGGVPWTTRPDRREALMREIRDGKLVHPCKVNHEVPRVLGDFAMRLLASNVTKRPETANEILPLLGQAAEDAGNFLIRVPPRKPWIQRGPLPTWSKRGGRKPRGQAMRAVLAAAAMFVVGVCVGGMAHQLVIESAEQTKVERKVETPRRSADTATDPKVDEPDSSQDAQGSEPPEHLKDVERGIPLPKRPYRGQMLAPCPHKYVEMIGACWKEIAGVNPDDTPAECPSDTIEVPGKNGQSRCFMWVRDTAPNSAKQMDGGTEE